MHIARNLFFSCALTLLVGCQSTTVNPVSKSGAENAPAQKAADASPGRGTPAASSSPANPSGGQSAALVDPGASMIAPMVERRETLVATGYAVISVQNHKVPAQQRLLAIRASKLDAYRSLAEQVYGQYLDSSTTVAEATVLSDTFRGRVEGVIYNAVLVSITPVGDDTYETTLSLDKSVVQDLRRLYLAQLAQRAVLTRAQ